jgi:phosphatidylglycerol---prolipoprotein diacylglyceryl transferase
MSAVLASIPSPSTGVYHLGPFTIHMYGVMLLLAIAACIWLTGVRWVRWGGDWDLVFRVAIWGVIAGIIGARLYHDATSWNQDQAIHDHWYGPIAVWQGGLGVWGGIPLGVLVGAWIVRRSGNSVRLFMDAVAPGLLLAQGIGRIGNWWNQELYGKVTTLPWGLEIHGKTVLYHPAFLYELIWDVLGVVVLLWVDRRFRLKRPGLFALYVSWYTAFRTYEEMLRIDPSTHFLGQRLNFWVSLVIFILSTAFFVWWQFLRRPEDEPSQPKPKKHKQPKPRPRPTGPRMTVPKGRVR